MMYICFYEPTGSFADRHISILIPFALTDNERPLLIVNVRKVKMNKLAFPYARGIEYFQYCSIAKADADSSIRLQKYLFYFIFARDIPRQEFWLLCVFNGSYRIILNIFVLEKEFAEVDGDLQFEVLKGNVIRSFSPVLFLGTKT